MNNTRIIGIFGGSSLFELGSTMDVNLFFDCLNMYVVKKHPEQDWRVLTDRLYRRYLRLNELEKAAFLMTEVKQVFAALGNKAVDWRGITLSSSTTWLDPNKATLADIFGKYFDSLAHCVESAKICYDGFKTDPDYVYQGVRLVIADLPWFLIDKHRPLEEYDALEGSPFWGRSKIEGAQ